jgi:hypothetical protein
MGIRRKKVGFEGEWVLDACYWLNQVVLGVVVLVGVVVLLVARVLGSCK